MNNTFSLKQISTTGNIDSNLISHQFKLNLMADFMRIKYENPKLKQSDKANPSSKSFSTLQRYRNDINMVSPNKIQPNNTNKGTKKTSNTIFDNNSLRELDTKRPQLTSNDLVKPEIKTKSNERNKNILQSWIRA